MYRYRSLGRMMRLIVRLWKWLCNSWGFSTLLCWLWIQIENLMADIWKTSRGTNQNISRSFHIKATRGVHCTPLDLLEMITWKMSKSLWLTSCPNYVSQNLAYRAVFSWSVFRLLTSTDWTLRRTEADVRWKESRSIIDMEMVDPREPVVQVQWHSRNTLAKIQNDMLSFPA